MPEPRRALWGLFALALSLSCAPKAPVIAEPDAVVSATLRYGDEARQDPVVLTLQQHWAGHRLADADAQRDPISTALDPAVQPTPGHEVFFYSGYGLNAHEDLGSVRLIYGLLLQKDPSGRLSGFFYEDRMVVPTTLWTVVGGVDGGQLSLVLSELTDPGIPGAQARLEGLIRPSP